MSYGFQIAIKSKDARSKDKAHSRDYSKVLTAGNLIGWFCAVLSIVAWMREALIYVLFNLVKRVVSTHSLKLKKKITLQPVTRKKSE